MQRWGWRYIFTQSSFVHTMPVGMRFGINSYPQRRHMSQSNLLKIEEYPGGEAVKIAKSIRQHLLQVYKTSAFLVIMYPLAKATFTVFFM